MSKKLIVTITMCLLSFASTQYLQADWLILKDGSEIETSGPWQVKGNVVVFSLPNGNLASLRLSEVDITSSSAFSLGKREETVLKSETETPAKRTAVYTITDDDVSHSDGQEEPAVQEDPSGNSASGLVVTAWDKAEAPGNNGLIVTGTLQNQGAAPLGGIVLSAILYDENGDVIVVENARLNVQALGPQRKTNFRLDLPDIFNFSTVSFETDTFELATPRPTFDVEENEATADIF